VTFVTVNEALPVFLVLGESITATPLALVVALPLPLTRPENWPLTTAPATGPLASRTVTDTRPTRLLPCTVTTCALMAETHIGTTGAWFTVIETVAEAVPPRLSVTVSVAVNDPTP
jgi:hypothetical protein